QGNFGMRVPPVLRQPSRARRRQHRLPEPLQDARHFCQPLTGCIDLGEESLDLSDNAALLLDRGNGNRDGAKVVRRDTCLTSGAAHVVGPVVAEALLAYEVEEVFGQDSAARTQNVELGRTEPEPAA